MIIIAITGASGVIYSLKLLEALKKLDIETGLIISDPAKLIIEHELNELETLKESKEEKDPKKLNKNLNKNLNENLKKIINLATYYYDSNDLTASINSGSFKFDSLVIVPCSMKTLSAIANGYGNNTITRVADVSLKERRKTIIVPRETPLRTAHLENMVKISKEGGIILPAMPAFYHNPHNIDEICDFVVGKILDSLKIDNNEFKRWK
ncbi:MAG: UbiX family flavin prenyltransferase [Methanobrevibacter sp.]|jgi:4-hydroxy-3-polyprenylbenzoate decarboxylase|nr:UbiX family flavin prenyltransferase [Methanobrevibacter sp.]